MTLIKKAPLELFIPTSEFIVKEVTARYEFVDGKRTDRVVGYNYRLANMESYDLIAVFVEQATPVITPDDLRTINEDGGKIVVELSGATVTPYYSTRTRSVEDSIKAAGIKIVRK